eukprot:2784517-Pyramimonas_sp.AAC.1
MCAGRSSAAVAILLSVWECGCEERGKKANFWITAMVIWRVIFRTAGGETPASRAQRCEIDVWFRATATVTYCWRAWFLASMPPNVLTHQNRSVGGESFGLKADRRVLARAVLEQC